MKTNYLFIALCVLSFFGVQSQSSVFKITNNTNGSAVLINGDVFYHSTASLATIEHDFEVKNISSTTKTLSVRKYDDVINTVSASDKAEAYFCTGTTCYQPTNYSASMVLNPNESVIFKAEFVEASTVGQSSIRFKFNDAANTSDALTLTLAYNNPLSVKTINSVFSSISNVYPNPSIGKTYINVTAAQTVDGVTLSILNSLGELVNTQPVILNKGVNKLVIDSENLSSGIYFLAINYNSSTISKKIIITK